MHLRLLCFLLVLIINQALSQKSITPTDQLVIEGEVKHKLHVSLMDLSRYRIYTRDSFRITNHLKEPRSLIRDLKLVLLKDVLAEVKIKSPGPKQLSEYYFIAEASDGYKVVFSWNELFNTPVGNEVYLVVGYDHQAGVQMPNRIALLSAGDEATGRRYLKGLKKMIIKRVH